MKIDVTMECRECGGRFAIRVEPMPGDDHDVIVAQTERDGEDICESCEDTHVGGCMITDEQVKYEQRRAEDALERRERERFSAAVAKMRLVEGGVVRVRDWPADGPRAAYRYATVELMIEREHLPVRLVEMSALTLEIGGHLMLHTYRQIAQVSIMVALSRDLDAEEEDASFTTAKSVALEAA